VRRRSQITTETPRLNPGAVGIVERRAIEVLTA
jgi:hypothetical protein